MCAYTYIANFPGSYYVNFLTFLNYNALHSSFSPSQIYPNQRVLRSPGRSIGNSNIIYFISLALFNMLITSPSEVFHLGEVPRTETPGLLSF